MRFKVRTLTITASLFLLTITIAHANILSTVASGVGNWIIENALASLIAAAIMLIGAFWGTTKWGQAIVKAKIPIQELKDVAVKVHRARLASSPGGKKITDGEKDEILKEVEEVVASVIAVFGHTPPTT